MGPVSRVARPCAGTAPRSRRPSSVRRNSWRWCRKRSSRMGGRRVSASAIRRRGAAFTATTFTIGAAEQAIIFDPLPSRQFGTAPFTVSATATGTPLIFSATGACAVGATTAAGSATTATVTLTNLGDCGLTATQTGSGSGAPASVVRHFTVTPGAPTLTWDAPATIGYGTALDAGDPGGDGERSGHLPLHPHPRRGLACGRAHPDRDLRPRWTPRATRRSRARCR